MQTYTDDQFTALIFNGAAPSAVLLAAADNVPFETLLNWTSTRQNLPQRIAVFAAEVLARKEAEANAPIKIRPGRDEGVILKSGKNRGNPGQATGAVLEISGAPRVFLPCTPGQVAAVLGNPLLALQLAIDTDKGEHDGRGYDRDPVYSALADLLQLEMIYQIADLESRMHSAEQPLAHASSGNPANV